LAFDLEIYKPKEEYYIRKSIKSVSVISLNLIQDLKKIENSREFEKIAKIKGLKCERNSRMESVHLKRQNLEFQKR